MEPIELKRRRDSYRFPCVGLHGSPDNYSEIRFDTQKALEHYNYNLLHHYNSEFKVLGYLSILYWGHYAGQTGRTYAARARAKVDLAVEGFQREKNGQRGRALGARQIGWDAISNILHNATLALTAGEFGRGLILLTELPGLQFAFASKVCSFLAPLSCGVIDSVIASRHPEFGFSLNCDGYIRSNRFNSIRYDEYCSSLLEVAVHQNSLGEAYKWIDQDGSRQSWFSVDVERALYVEAN